MATFWNTIERTPRPRSQACILRVLFSLTAFTAYCGVAVAEVSNEAQSVRNVIARAVPFIERKGADWITNKECLSCHQTTFMLWSLNAATERGIPVDQDKLRGWTEWAVDWRHLLAPTIRAAANREETLRGQCDTVAQLILGRAALNSGVNTPEWVNEYAMVLMTGQQDDGSWKPGGQLPSQKRPLRETQEVSTMWALIAFDDRHIHDEALLAGRERALTWLGDATFGESTEWWAARTLLERRLSRVDRADRCRTELLKLQRSDGGWGWRCKDDSDVLGTGIALYAIAQSELHTSHQAINNARQFLMRAQSDDGSWPVRGTKQNAKDRVETTSTYWGTCWAVIGLCETLEK
jgi:squalene cyclase